MHPVGSYCTNISRGTVYKTLKQFSHYTQIYFSSVHIFLGESNGKLPLRTCTGCSVQEPYQSPDWALVSAQTGPRAEYL